MKKNNKFLALFIAVLVIAFSPLLIIKTFKLNDKVKIENKEKEADKFSLISIITSLDDENRKMVIFIFEAFLAGGLAGFFMGNLLAKNKKKKEIISGETICPLCKEKFLKKTYKNEK